eukprot:gene4484-7865_t
MSHITKVPQIPEVEKIEKDEDKIPTYELDPKACPIKSVKIYQNKAQIVREVTFHLSVGEQKIAMNGVPHSLEVSSLRSTGTGDANILETYYFEKYEDIYNDMTTKKNIQAEMKEIIEKRDSLKLKLSNHQKKNKFLDDFSKSIIDQSRPHKDLYQLVSKETVNELKHFQNYFTEQNEKVDKETESIKTEIEDLNEKLVSLNKTFHEEKQPVEQRCTKQAVILLDGLKEGNCTLELSYIVTNASWVPSYDLRASSTSEKFKIIYYGNISQSTGEEWKNTKISLSTADPSTSNAPPTIKGSTVGIYVPPPVFNNSMHFMNKKSLGASMRNKALEMDYFEDECEMAMGPCAEVEKVVQQNLEYESMKTVSSKSEKSTTSSVFHIEKSTTIPSDGISHKVQIGEIELTGVFNHSTVPKLDAKAYAKVTAENTSDYPLLPGSMNIFIDYNFVAKGTMQKVLQTEKLETYLGVDPSVKVTYVLPHRYKETKGWIKGTNKMNVARKIKIKNTKDTQIEINVEDQLPLSTEKKIVVELLNPEMKPDIKKLEKVKLGKVEIDEIEKNDSNNIKWKLKIKPNEEIEIPFLYNNSISNYRSFEKQENQYEILSEPIKLLQKIGIDENEKITDEEVYKSIFYELFRCLQDASFPKDSVQTVDSLAMDLYKAMKIFDEKFEEFLDTDMYNLVLETFANHKSDVFFNIVIVDMKENQTPIDKETFKMMIKLAVNQRDYQKVMKLCTIMRKMGFEIDESVKGLISENPFMGF